MGQNLEQRDLRVSLRVSQEDEGFGFYCSEEAPVPQKELELVSQMDLGSKVSRANQARYSLALSKPRCLRWSHRADDTCLTGLLPW